MAWAHRGEGLHAAYVVDVVVQGGRDERTGVHKDHERWCGVLRLCVIT